MKTGPSSPGTQSSCQPASGGDHRTGPGAAPPSTATPAVKIIVSIVSNIIILVTGHLDCEAGGAEELDLVLLVLVDQVPAEVPGLGRQLGQGQPLVRLLDCLLARGGGLQGAGGGD